MKLAPCKNSKNRAFIDPHRSSKFTISAAEKICSHCPLIKECAVQALQGGNVLDQRHTGPADGVFQAGIICHGDESTAIRLAEIAGITQLPYGEEKKRRRGFIHDGDRCVNCNLPLFRWTRGIVPKGYVLHYARNYCSNCRVEYRRAYPSRGRKFGKIVDRNNHSAPKRTNTEAAHQYALFSKRDLSDNRLST